MKLVSIALIVFSFISFGNEAPEPEKEVVPFRPDASCHLNEKHMGCGLGGPIFFHIYKQRETENEEFWKGEFSGDGNIYLEGFKIKSIFASVVVTKVVKEKNSPGRTVVYSVFSKIKDGDKTVSFPSLVSPTSDITSVVCNKKAVSLFEAQIDVCLHFGKLPRPW